MYLLPVPQYSQSTPCPDLSIAWILFRLGLEVYDNARLHASSRRFGEYLSASFSKAIQPAFPVIHNYAEKNKA